MPHGRRIGVALAAAAMSVASAAAAAQAQPPTPPRPSSLSSGTSGYCRDDSGVTVVVDLSALGGDVVVRCASGPVGAGFSGIDALQGAGFDVTGTQRYGLAFVCRIQGRPAPDEPLAIPGNPDYREQCIDTPPQTAFWGYWYAPNGGSWTFSTAGAQSHDAIPGGFEGWAFSLGSGSPPQPAVDPLRPGAPTTPPTPTPAPTSSPPSPHHRNHGGGTGTGPTAPTSAPSPSGPAATSPTPSAPGQAISSPPTTSAPAPGDAQATKSGGSAPGRRSGNRKASHQASALPGAQTGRGDASDVKVTGELPDSAEQSAGSAVPTIIGIGVLALLGFGAGLTAWRRSHRA